jgi:transcriptional repressor NrdR
MQSFMIALRKRNIDRDRVDRAVSGIIRRLESSGETEITSEDIGLQVLEALKALDDVAFVRYASVYRDFTHIEDFAEAIAQINAKLSRESVGDV